MNQGLMGWLRSLLAPPPLRPPGAKTEAEFSALCIRCDRCIQVCPYGTLRPAGFGSGVSVGAPLMVPARVPCYLCMLCPPVCPTLDPLRAVRFDGCTNCMRCLEACPSGALKSNINALTWIRDLFTNPRPQL